MRPLVRFMFGCLLVLLATQAWAKQKPPLPVPLDPALPVLIVLPQSQIGIAPWPYGPWSYNYTGPEEEGILLVELLKLLMLHDNERRIVSIREKLRGSDFRGRLEAELRKRVLAPEISPAPIISVSFKPWTDEEALAATAASAGRFMLVTGTYGFDEGFGALTVYVLANVHTVKRKTNGKVVYDTERTRLYQATYIKEGRSKGTTINANLWSGVPTEQLVRMMETAIDSAGELFAYDLSAAGQAESMQKVKLTLDRRGRVVKSFPDHAWSRISEDFLVSRWALPESMLLH